MIKTKILLIIIFLICSSFYYMVKKHEYIDNTHTINSQKEG